jgi:hypothetical protein
VLKRLDDELARQLRKQRRLALPQQLSCSGGGSKRGEESTDFIRECYTFRGLIGGKEPRSGGAFAGGGAESGQSRGHFFGGLDVHL